MGSLDQDRRTGPSVHCTDGRATWSSEARHRTATTVAPVLLRSEVPRVGRRAVNEAGYISEPMITNGVLVGSAEQVIARLRAYADAGLDQVMILPAFEPRYAVLERVGRDVLPYV